MAEAASYPGFDRVYSYVERGFYGRQLARALDLFPREQILLLQSEALKQDPTGTIGAVCDFLGIPAPDRAASKRSRIAAEIGYPVTLTPKDVIFLQQQFLDEMTRFRFLSGIDLGKGKIS
jgi:hypothetical protein